MQLNYRKYHYTKVSTSCPSTDMNHFNIYAITIITNVITATESVRVICTSVVSVPQRGCGGQRTMSCDQCSPISHGLQGL